jgi:hypothetical protein
VLSDWSTKVVDDPLVQSLLYIFVCYDGKKDEIINRLNKSKYWEQILLAICGHPKLFPKLLPDLLKWSEDYGLSKEIQKQLFIQAKIDSEEISFEEKHCWVYALLATYVSRLPGFRNLIEKKGQVKQAIGELFLCHSDAQIDLVRTKIRHLLEIKEKRDLFSDKAVDLSNFLITLEEKKNWPDLSSFINKIERLKEGESAELLLFFFNNPEMLKKFTKDYFLEEALEITPSGQSKHTFSKITLPFLKNLTSDHLFRQENSPLQKAHHKVSIPKLIRNILILGKIHGIFGRTLVVQPDKNSKELHAFKFCRDKESVRKFCRENAVTKVYFKNRELFQSEIPKPMGLYVAKNIYYESNDRRLENFPRKNGNYLIYHYKTINSDYFTYLHDSEKLDLKEYDKARKISIVDTNFQFIRGIFPDMAPIFHNEESSRLYVPTPNIFHDNFNSGAGRLNKWSFAIEYPNLRKSGIADLADVKTKKNCMKNPITFLQAHLDLSIVPKEIIERKNIMLTFNALTRLLLIDLLTTA